MTKPVARDTPGWIRQTQRTLDSQGLKPRGIGPIRYGVVGPFWTSGVPYVTMDDDQSIVTVGGWSASYTPTNGDHVAVVPLKDTAQQVHILGPRTLAPAQPKYLQQLSLLGKAGIGNNATYYPGTFTKTADGIVMLQGALVNTSGATWPAGKPIATLPDGFRPDYDLLFPMAYYGGAFSSMTVSANGDIYPNVAFSTSTSQYWALGNVAFPAAGVANWTYYDDPGSGMAFQNGFTPVLSTTGPVVANYGKPRFWVDSNDFVWGQGCAQVGAITADDTTIISLPPAFQASYMNHCVTVANSSYMGLLGTRIAAGSAPNLPGITWKTSPQTSGILSLSTLTGYEKAGASNSWSAFPGAGTWTAYSSLYTPPQYIVLPNKMVRLRGLLKGPANPVLIGTLPAGARGTQDAVHTAGGPSSRAAANNYAYIENNPSGAVWQTANSSGSNAWFSFDVMQFALGG